MGHNFEAIVCKKPINVEFAKSYGFPIIYESDFAIIPIFEDNLYYFMHHENIKFENYGDEISIDLLATIKIAQKLGAKNWVLLHSVTPEFLGSYYEKGVKLNHEINISSALKKIGVNSKLESGEFNELNLDGYRQGAGYYEGWGYKPKPNIFPGKLLQLDYKNMDDE